MHLVVFKTLFVLEEKKFKIYPANEFRQHQIELWQETAKTLAVRKGIKNTSLIRVDFLRIMS